VTADEIMLWKTDRLMSVDFDGELKREFPRPVKVHPQQTTYREMGKLLVGLERIMGP
jgi:hypothetical protein